MSQTNITGKDNVQKLQTWDFLNSHCDWKDVVLLDQPLLNLLLFLLSFKRTLVSIVPRRQDYDAERPYTIPKSNSIPFCKVEFTSAITGDIRESVSPASLLLVLSVSG